MYLQDFVKKNPISESETKAAYEEYKKAYGDKEYSARHILVKTESEAKDIIAQLGKGGDFAKIAKEKSLDPGSKEKGGDLGWFSPASMVKPFSDVAINLQKGSISTNPVQTQFGWHVIKLIDTRTAQPLPFDKVKDGIQKNLQQRNLEKMMAELRTKAKIDISK
jgi:peptidyl-prolyl cis-trans isomerase C